MAKMVMVDLCPPQRHTGFALVIAMIPLPGLYYSLITVFAEMDGLAS